MRGLFILAALLLAGCTNSPETSPPATGKPPAGFFKILTGKDFTSYADLRVVSAYQGNSNLRRFYMINNYAKPARLSENPPTSIASSRAVNVINCTNNQRAVMARNMFSEPFAEGKLMSKGTSIGQWQSFPEDSLIGILAGFLCKIPAEKLKPEPAAETRQPLLDF
uniref:surface-adhesin E family protein n=1 Tax=Pantoea sp. IMH TaxID=1267600 RepID=UPI000468BAC0|nr:surface-adhesin E family protein [Pantoea sp. IMH]